MSEHNQKGTIVLGLSLEDEDHEVAKFAFWVAKTMHCNIKAVHVCGPTYYVPTSIGVGLPEKYFFPDYDTLEHSIYKSLETFTKEPMFKDIKLDVSVHSGDIANWLTAESSSASMVVVGSHVSKYSVLRKLTTAYKVLGSTKVPVAIVPTDVQFDFENQEPRRVLLADDLESHTADAADFAFDFVSHIKGAKMYHLHVSGLSKAGLKIALNQAAASSYRSNESLPDVDVIYDEVQENLKGKLADRTLEWRYAFELNETVYERVIKEGLTDQVVAEVRKEYEPNIEIYGKHQSFHYKPFSFGRLPFDAMLTGKNIVIIVPQK